MTKMKRLLFILMLKLTEGYFLTSRDNVTQMLECIEKEYLEFCAVEAVVKWKIITDPQNPEATDKMAEIQKDKLNWLYNSCEGLATLEEAFMLDEKEQRLRRLLCSGPIYTYDEYKQILQLNEELTSIYHNAKLCIPSSKVSEEAALQNFSETVDNAFKEIVNTTKCPIEIAIKNSKVTADGTLCLKADSEFHNVMGSVDNPDIMKVSWIIYRHLIGPKMKEPYLKMVEIQNRAARRNGYTDMGAAITDQLEFPEQDNYQRFALMSINQMYVILHGIMRHSLRQKFGDVVPRNGTIPAHLLGDIWGQDWSTRMNLIYPEVQYNVHMKNWTVLDTMKRAEEFYVSLGFPMMTEKFWNNSSLDNRKHKCQAQVIDMYTKDDYRIYSDCSGNSLETLYLFHKEMAKIHYFMAYENQIGLFRGSNEILLEAIGNAIVYGVNAPSHLYRLGLVEDKYLESDTPCSLDVDITTSDYHLESDLKIFTKDKSALLKLAFEQIPQIPLSVVLEEYNGKLYRRHYNNLNGEFWDLVEGYQGLSPGAFRATDQFDFAAYIPVHGKIVFTRKYLSALLQYQIFEALCKASLFGENGHLKELPESMDLHKCDIYGSKEAGNLLRKLMSKGNTDNWVYLFKIIDPKGDLSRNSFDRYYKPLLKDLECYTAYHNIPLGWNKNKYQ